MFKVLTYARYAMACVRLFEAVKAYRKVKHLPDADAYRQRRKNAKELAFARCQALADRLGV